jgi:hypothetical protein
MNPQRNPEPTNSHDIDRVLTALGNIQPPAHIERRVLAAIENGSASASRWTFSPSSSQQWSVVACAAVIVLAGVGLSVHRHRLGTNVAVAPTTAVTRRPRTQTLAAERGPAPVAPALRVAAKGSAPRAGALTRDASINGRPRLLCDCDPTAVAEANAPSLPAPPLPLTEQERLLLRIAHHPGPVELAELDAHQREVSIAEEQAAYKRFFHPAGPLSPDAPTSQPAPSALPATSAQPATLAQPDPQPQPDSATQPQTSIPAPNGDQP